MKGPTQARSGQMSCLRQNLGTERHKIAGEWIAVHPNMGMVGFDPPQIYYHASEFVEIVLHLSNNFRMPILHIILHIAYSP